MKEIFRQISERLSRQKVEPVDEDLIEYGDEQDRPIVDDLEHRTEAQRLLDEFYKQMYPDENT